MAANRRFLIVLGTLALIVYLSLAILSNKDLFSTGIRTNDGPQTFTIVHTDRGFQPDSLALQVGDTVRFVSVGAEPFWPASDPHPSHVAYAGFDSKRPVPGDGSWSFAFDRIGRWNFHDHLAPGFTGTITVGSPSEKRDDCAVRPDSLFCWRSIALAENERKGPKAAIERVIQMYQETPEISLHCHMLAHDIGVASYQHYLANPESVFSPNFVLCAGGFYHGFMEALLTAVNDPVKAGSFCARIGQRFGRETPEAELQCYHGIGHGAMDIALGAQLLATDEESHLSPQRLMEPAFELCRSATKEPQRLYRCTSAVFNSLASIYISPTLRSTYRLPFDSSDPLAVCRTYSDPALQDGCYGNFNFLLFISSGRDLRTAAKFVENIPDDERAKSAMDYLANASAASTVRKDAAKAIADCRSVQERLVTSCLEGLVHGLLENGEPRKEAEEVFAFCSHSSLVDSERDICYQYVLSRLHGWYSRAEGEQLCARAPEQYRKFCVYRES